MRLSLPADGSRFPEAYLRAGVDPNSMATAPSRLTSPGMGRHRGQTSRVTCARPSPRQRGRRSRHETRRSWEGCTGGESGGLHAWWL